MTTPLTAQSSIADWLAHPVGGDLVRGLLAQSGANADSLAPIVGLPLQQLVVLSQGQMPQSVVDDLVRAANGGEMPEETGPTGWVEKVTGGRFSGQTVNVSSEAGLRGNASGNAYTVSKHGVIGLTKSAAFQYGPAGIRVNAVAPGGVATGIPMAPTMSQAGSARLAPFQNAIPSIATAEQLAASITFLLSDDGVNINGASLASDGGWSVQ